MSAEEELRQKHRDFIESFYRFAKAPEGNREWEWQEYITKREEYILSNSRFVYKSKEGMH